MVPPTPQADNDATIGGVRAAGLALLLVDDNRDAALMLKLVLESAGHNVTLAADGTSAVEEAESRPFDAIICDIGLPGELDGFDVARVLRAGTSTARVPLIALSGYGSAQDETRSLQAGFDAHVAKPVGSKELQRILYEVMAHSKGQTPSA